MRGNTTKRAMGMTDKTRPFGEVTAKLDVAWNYVRKDLQQWSFVHFAFAFGVTVIVGTVIGVVAKMNWVPTVIISIAIFWSIYFGMAVWRYEQDRQRSLKAMNTDDPIAKAIERIRVAETHDELRTAIEAASSMLKAFRGFEDSRAFWDEVQPDEWRHGFERKKSVAMAYLDGLKTFAANEVSKQD